MRQHGQGFALAVLFFPSGPHWLTSRVIPSAEEGGLGAAPRERGVADVAPRCPGAFARRFPGPRDETTGGGTILHPREARAIVHFVEEYEAEDLADAGDRLPQIEGLGVMVLGRCDEGAFDSAPQRIVGGDERQVPCDA